MQCAHLIFTFVLASICQLSVHGSRHHHARGAKKTKHKRPRQRPYFWRIEYHCMLKNFPVVACCFPQIPACRMACINLREILRRVGTASCMGGGQQTSFSSRSLDHSSSTVHRWKCRGTQMANCSADC